MKSLLTALSGLRQNIRCVSFRHIYDTGTRRAFSNGFIKLAKQAQVKPRPNTAPPLRAPPPPTSRPGKPSTGIDKLLGDGDKVLLYVSPKHGSLYISSYLIGGAFLFGAYSWAQFALKEQPTDQKRSRFIKLALSAEVLIVVVLGTHFLLTPTKLIKTITILRAATSTSAPSSTEPLLRLEIKRGLPFLKPDVLEIAPSNIFREPRLVSADPTVQQFTVPLAEAHDFTARYFSGEDMGPPVPRSGSVRSIWPAIKRDTRRMFMRDQMAYLRTSNNGRFKLDMQGAVFLGDDTLFRIIPTDHEERVGLVGYIRGIFSG